MLINFNKYYGTNIVSIALSFLLGVLIFQISRDLPPLFVFLLLPIAFLLVIRLPCAFLFLIIALGYFWSYIFALFMIYPKLEHELEGKDIDLNGVIYEVKSQSRQYSQFVLYVDKASIDQWNNQLPEKIILGWYTPQQTIIPNQQCDFIVRLKRHWRFANPGSFDREKNMFLHGIGARGYVREGHCKEKILKGFVSLRESLIIKFSTVSQNYKYSNLMQALTFGYRDHIDQSQWQILRKTGTTHLLAISGLHISAISLFVFFVIKNLTRCSARLCEFLPAEFIAALFALIAAMTYAHLAGFSLPTQRALIMVGVALLAIFLRKPIVSISVYCLALLAVLIIQPMSVLSAGFWLSFLAVLFIFVILKSTENSNKWARIIWVQCYLGAALFPVSLLFFSEASLISPFVNIIAIPIVSFIILPLLLFTQLLFALHIEFSQWLFLWLDELFDWFWYGLSLAANFKYSTLEFHPSLLGVIAYELGLFLIIQVKYFPARYLSWVLIIALFLIKPPSLKPSQMRLTVLDVGQGLAVVIETANHALIYDAGARSISGFNTGSAVVQPFMQHQAIRYADVAVISHNDNDHAGGMHTLLAANLIKQLIISNEIEQYQAADIKLCRSGEAWHWDSVIFRFLHPPMKWQSNDNNRSCVLQIVHPAGVILLPGDIEKSAENWLVDQYGDELASNLIVAPHHGSQSSSSYRFLDRVHPQTAVFSAGYRNRYGFPHATIRQRYQEVGAQIVDIAHEGAVTFLFDAKTGIQKQPGYRLRHKRYWHSAVEEFTNSTE